jgi:hypothetical protein
MRSALGSGALRELSLCCSSSPKPTSNGGRFDSSTGFGSSPVSSCCNWWFQLPKRMASFGSRSRTEPLSWCLPRGVHVAA